MQLTSAYSHSDLMITKISAYIHDERMLDILMTASMFSDLWSCLYPQDASLTMAKQYITSCFSQNSLPKTVEFFLLSFKPSSGNSRNR